MSEQNKVIARRLLDALWNQQDFAVVDDLLAADYDGHSSTVINGPDGAKAFVPEIQSAFPDFQMIFEDQIAEDDKIVTRWTATGTHNGEFQGMPPTGNNVTLTGITIFRIVDGKIRDGWTHEDLLGFMRQIGAIPELPH
jgi:steroid delta-isomerase-like uncharacterized protein